MLNEHIISPDTFVIIFYRCTLEDFKQNTKNWRGLDRMNSIMSCRRIPVLDSYALQQTNKHEIRIKKRRRQSLGLFFLGIERWLKVKKKKYPVDSYRMWRGRYRERNNEAIRDDHLHLPTVSPTRIVWWISFFCFFPLWLVDDYHWDLGFLAFFFGQVLRVWKDFWMKAVSACSAVWRVSCSPVAKSTSASRIEISAAGGG